MMTTEDSNYETKNVVKLVLDLRVLVTVREGRWFAQGLEVDYAAQGSSWMEVQKAFEVGFIATTKAHLEKYGHLKHFFRAAPARVFRLWNTGEKSGRSSQSSLVMKLVRDFQRAEIEFHELAA